MSANEKFYFMFAVAWLLLICLLALIFTVPVDYWPLGTWPSVLIDKPIPAPTPCRVYPNHYGEALFGVAVNGEFDGTQWRIQVEPEGGFQDGKTIQVDTFVRYGPVGSAFPPGRHLILRLTPHFGQGYNPYGNAKFDCQVVGP